MRKLVVVGVVAALALGWTMVYAADPPAGDRPAAAPAESLRAFGKIKSVDLEAGKMVVNARTTRDGEAADMTFAVDKEKTKVTEGENTPKTLADLKEGLNVVVMYDAVPAGAAAGTLPVAKQVRIWAPRPQTQD